MPLIYLKATGPVAEPVRLLATALVSSFFYLGQFMSPIILGMVGKISGNPSVKLVFISLAVALLVSLAIAAMLAVKSQYQEKKTFQQ